MNLTRISGCAVLLVSLLLGACGGGGGSSSNSSSSSSGSTSSSGSSSGATPALSLLAGDAGGTGNADAATALAATFNRPAATAVDASGNLYVADTYNHKIRRIAVDGVVTTLAGSGTPGSADGTGTGAGFNHPMGIAVDTSGNVFVADTNNCTIRKITANAEVTTVFGTAGTCGAATLNAPIDIDIDATGALYVADRGNQVIRKIAPDGTMTTFAGGVGMSGYVNDTGTAARFDALWGIAVDSSGNVYVADAGNHLIRKISPAGVVTTLAGTAQVPGSADGAGVAASFRSPLGIDVDGSGNVYVSDYGNHTIRRIDAAANVTTVAGTAGSSGYVDANGTSARLYYPAGIEVDAAGNAWFTEGVGYVRKLANTGEVSLFAGSTSYLYGHADGSGTAARFRSTAGMTAAPNGTLFVLDNQSLRQVTTAGVVTTPTLTGATPAFSTPLGIAADASGNLYLADTYNHLIRKIDSSGTVTVLAGSGTDGFVNGNGAAASFAWPEGLAVDGSGNVYVADRGNHAIRKITPAGVVTTLAGSGTAAFTDGTGTGAAFNQPVAIVLDTSGNLYVAESENHAIRKVTPTGVVTTVAGTGTAGSADGTGTAASFWYPKGLALDGSGNLYVADQYNHTIRKITPAGVVTTVVGKAGVKGFEAGSLPGTIRSPYGLAIVGTTLYFTTGYGIAQVTNLP
jgi:sugar lactone lactonase YvrE